MPVSRCRSWATVNCQPHSCARRQRWAAQSDVAAVLQLGGASGRHQLCRPCVPYSEPGRGAAVAVQPHEAGKERLGYTGMAFVDGLLCDMVPCVCVCGHGVMVSPPADVQSHPERHRQSGPHVAHRLHGWHAVAAGCALRRARSVVVPHGEIGAVPPQRDAEGGAPSRPERRGHRWL